MHEGLQFPRASMHKRKIQARSKQNIVLLSSRRRIGHIDVAERVLPPQPLADLGHSAEVECRAILAGVIQIREEVELLAQQGVHPQLVVQFFAHRHGGKAAAGQRSVFFTGVVKAAKQVQRGADIVDRVPAQAAAKDGTQIKSLQSIGLEIRADVAEQPGSQIMVITELRPARALAVVAGVAPGASLVAYMLLVYRLNLSRKVLRSAVKASARFLVRLLPRVSPKPTLVPPCQPSRRPGCSDFS